MRLGELVEALGQLVIAGVGVVGLQQAAIKERVNKRLARRGIQSKVFAQALEVYPHAVGRQSEDTGERPLGAAAQGHWL